ncbi:hypothetical protein HBI37_170910 [Parastagonospora nodorum]|nr:hypothetical protein HBI37_170910 [Parastagonospora nodorum]KAH6346288.1 hypothetical protein HBI36_156050 [Parastagonospora nodorum]
MLQTNVREGYRITTLEVIELVEDLTSYVKKKDLLKKIQSEKSQSQLLKSLRSPTLKDWLAVAKCTQLRNAQIPKVFHKAAAGTIWTMMLAKVRQYGAKVKTEDLSNTLTPTLSETAQRRSSSVVSNRSTASITDKFSVASLTEPAILNDANVALVDAVHHSVVKQFPMFRLMTKESQQKLEENYFEVIDALTMTLIKDDDDLLGTVNSHIKLRRLRAVMLLLTFQSNELPEQPSPPEQLSLSKKRGRHSKLIPDGPPLKRRKTEAADSRHAKASRRRTKKDKDLEDSDTSSDVPRLRRRDRAAACARLAKRKQLGKEAQLKKTRDEEELAKAKKEKEEKEARERKTQPDSPLDSDDYRSDSSSDIDSKDDLEDEEATTAKDLAREQKERLKALLNAKTRDGLSARVGTAIEHCTLEEWTSAVVFFGVSINNLQNKRTIKLPACWGVNAYILYFKELLSDNSRIFANAIGIGKTRAIVLATEVQNVRAEGNAIEHNAVDDDDKLCPTEGERTFYCADPLALRFCFFSDSPLENIGRPTKEEAIEMRIDTTDAISKALAAANKLVALWSYIIPEANTPAVHPEATKHRSAPLAARFVIVCSFRKVDKHVFRAYNIISVTAQRTIIRKGGPYVEKRAILLPGHKAWALSGTPIEQGLNEILIFVSLALISLQNKKGVSNWFNATDKRDSVTGDRIYKMEDTVYWLIAETLSHRTRQNTALNSLAMAKQWRNIIANVKHDASEHESSYNCLCPDFLSTVQNAEQQCRDILEKEGLNELEASRRVIFNCFEMQAIASYPALATLKAAYVKDLFTNLSKDYFLVREARAITKSSLKFQNLSNLCSEVEILGTLSRTWSIAAEDAAKAANTPLPPKEVCAKILIGSYKPIVQARDPDGPWIMVASMAFAEAITLTEATHVVIMEPQDRQNTQDQFIIVYFNPDSELELKVLGKQDVKTTS